MLDIAFGSPNLPALLQILPEELAVLCASGHQKILATTNMNTKKPSLSFSNELAPMGQYINGEISLDEFMHWLKTTERKVPIKTVEYSLLISREEQDRRRDAVEKATTSLMLEGFVIPPEVASLDERYIVGEITLDEKLAILHKMYRGG